MTQYIKKTETVRAFQMTNERIKNVLSWPEWLNDDEGERLNIVRCDRQLKGRYAISVRGCKSELDFMVDDWIICDDKGELSVCSPNSFFVNYTLDKWQVNVLGNSQRGYEISVLRNSNSQGQRSYCWFSKDKILISRYFERIISGFGESFLDNLFKRTIAVAEMTADDLNEEESNELSKS